ncbi:MAG: DUF4395 domain-containing protein [Streptosporangiaceae bacterium]
MQLDPRGPRFAAAITTIVLAVVLVTGSMPLLAAQAAVFGVGAFAGLRVAPYGLVYRYLVRPRLRPPSEFEPAEPPRFAQGVGFVFAVIGVIGYASGVTLLGVVATACALFAAFLNAAFGFCLGCEMYIMIRRLLPPHSNREVPQ